jgi:hypothetical protein
MDVASCLRNLGLERYEAAFRENDVDSEVLPALTADDLKELGVTSVGHRRQLLEAIVELRSQGAPAGDPARFHPGRRPVPRRPWSVGNRGRTPATQRHVLRSRRLDRPLAAAPSRGSKERSFAPTRPALSRPSSSLTASSPGWSLAFRAAAGIIVIVVLGLTPLRARIWAEERLLIQTFGAEYVTYLERTWRLALHLG